MRFGKKRDEDVAIQLTSMTDMVFLLLIFYMISSTFSSPQKRLDVQLPEAKTAEIATERKHYLIDKGHDKKIYLDGKEITEEELGKMLQAPSGKTETKRSVLIRADKRLPYGNVIRVMEISRESKIFDIGVAVK
ncbi:MAG: biopolymer transporter ExbD [Candidatus Tectomicrobia bacterium]|nr:biopolymer transporter ExbD [Candidatus Tectomicrobia bacterium]